MSGVLRDGFRWEFEISGLNLQRENRYEPIVRNKFSQGGLFLIVRIRLS